MEPRNADSHLAFIAAGLSTCVSYVNRPEEPVCFVDLDGVTDGRPRRRLTSIVGFTREREVSRLRIDVPVSDHPVDSVNLKDPKLGIYEQILELVKAQGVTSGRVRLELAGGERQAGLTVNEYETLLMRHDLAEVLRNPIRYAAEKGRHMWAHPRAIPAKARDYAKYDMVRALNQMLDVTGLRASLLERLFARAIAVPAGRFLRMKRTVNLRVRDSDGHGVIADGRYQSPILVQWHRADAPRPRDRRHAHQLRIRPRSRPERSVRATPSCERRISDRRRCPGSSAARSRASWRCGAWPAP